MKQQPMLQLFVGIEQEEPDRIVWTIHGSEMLRHGTPMERVHMSSLCAAVQGVLIELGLRYATQRAENAAPNTAVFHNAL